MAETTILQIDLLSFIILIAAIVGGSVSAGIYISKLSGRIKKLEDEMKNNPIFTAIRQIERDTLIDLVNDLLVRRENRNG